MEAHPVIEMEQLLYEKIRPIVAEWREPDIYAVSFFVYSNEEYRYGPYENVPTFEISFNTEEGCAHAVRRSEERWNFAYWPQDTVPIIAPEHPDGVTKALFDWFRQEGVDDPGAEEDWEDGPIGFRMLVELAGGVARRLHDEGFFPDIPILIHDLEYTECTREATRHANPGGEAADFLADWETAEPEPDPDIAAAVRDIFADVMENILGHSTEIKREIFDEADGLNDEKMDELMKLIFGA